MAIGTLRRHILHLHASRLIRVERASFAEHCATELEDIVHAQPEIVVDGDRSDCDLFFRLLVVIAHELDQA